MSETKLESKLSEISTVINIPITVKPIPEKSAEKLELIGDNWIPYWNAPDSIHFVWYLDTYTGERFLKTASGEDHKFIQWYGERG